MASPPRPAHRRRPSTGKPFPTQRIDHRLAPQARLAAILEDIEAAYKWVYQEGNTLFGIDPDRIAIVGHSSGGYLTLMAGIRLSPRPRALVSFYGFGNMTGDWTVKPSSSYLLMAGALERHGIAHQLITHAEWEHLFDLTQAGHPRVEEALDGVVSFLQEHL